MNWLAAYLVGALVVFCGILHGMRNRSTTLVWFEFAIFAAGVVLWPLAIVGSAVWAMRGRPGDKRKAPNP